MLKTELPQVRLHRKEALSPVQPVPTLFQLKLYCLSFSGLGINAGSLDPLSAIRGDLALEASPNGHRPFPTVASCD